MFKWIKNQAEGTKNTAKKLTDYDTIKGFAQDTAEIAGKVLSPKEAIKNARTETFAEAQKRQGVNDVDLMLIYKNFAWITVISLGFSILCFTLATYFLFHGNFMQGLAGIAFMLYSLAQAFKYSFRAYQIKHKNLCSVQRWWDSASEWIPNPFAN
jgi:hypothetical protein